MEFAFAVRDDPSTFRVSREEQKQTYDSRSPIPGEARHLHARSHVVKTSVAVLRSAQVAVRGLCDVQSDVKLNLLSGA